MISFPITSVHYGIDGVNERNYGAGIEIPRSPSMAYTGGFFRNSYDDFSIYGGMSFEGRRGFLSVGVIGGAVSGYPQADVLPVVAPFVSFGNERMNLQAVQLGPWATGIQIRISF